VILRIAYSLNLLFFCYPMTIYVDRSELPDIGGTAKAAALAAGVGLGDESILAQSNMKR
jgi:hypothetical protein